MSNDREKMHPLLLGKNRRWVGTIEKGMSDLDAQLQKWVMQEAGKDCTFECTEVVMVGQKTLLILFGAWRKNFCEKVIDYGDN